MACYRISDISLAQPLLDALRIAGKLGRMRERSRWLLADKGYNAEYLQSVLRLLPDAADNPITCHAAQT
jgi:hypothetical protein